MKSEPTNEQPSSSSQRKGVDAVLTEAVRHVDVIHTSLAGMTAIVLMLLFAVALPVLGRPPVTHPLAFWVMAVASFVGITGLYILNYRVHKHVTDQARLTEVLVNSLGQGFLFFDRGGFCGPVYSQACLDLLECMPANQHVTDVLQVAEDQRSDFKEWVEVLFQQDHALSFDDVIRFLPQFYTHNPNRRISLEYKPIMGSDGRLWRVVMIATDLTDEYVARQLATRQQNFAEMICRIFKDRNQFQATLAHIRELLDDIKAHGDSLEDSPRIQRQIHTLKAAVKQFNLVDLGDVLHDCENMIRDPAVTNNETYNVMLADIGIKIDESLKRVTDEVSSLIGTEYEWRGNMREIGEADIYDFAREMKTNHVDPAIVSRFIDTIAAIPIRDCFRSFERELRELIAVMDKQIKPIRYVGSNPRVLTQSIQEFLFSLTHICRNIADHGIEPPVTRMARGKDPAGQVTVEFSVVNDGTSEDKWLELQISDDGNGIDPSRVRAKLYTTDPEGSWRFEDDHTVIQRIFSWNFTTSESITAMSGRGIGMEAVEQEVKKLGGSIRVSSVLYKGATFLIRVPYKFDLF